MASDFVTGHEQSAAFEAEFTKAGCQVVKKIMAPLGTTDFAPFLSQLAATDADAVWAMFFAADAIAFVKQYDALGIKAKLPLIGPAGLVDPPLLNAMGKSGVGVAAPIYYFPTLDNAENKQFVEAYRARHNRLPGATTASGYLAAMAISAAITSLKGDVENKPALLKALKEVKLATPIGPFQFDDKQNIVFDLYLGRVAEQSGTYGIEIVEPVLKRVNQFGVAN
jgi:branched-chain amino acid transport system substrate-binding protein